jgi:outer membrane protein OmpA-like peptidoglycan-associated protein
MCRIGTFRGLKLLLAATLVQGCVTKGYVHRQVERQVERERVAAHAADSAHAGEVAALRAELAALRTELMTLRNDLQTLRTEFGARITSMDDAVFLALPVHFARWGAEVLPTDTATLNRIVAIAAQGAEQTFITVMGHVDSVEARARARESLALRRAEYVKAYLIARGLPANRVLTVDMGLTRPIASSNLTSDERARLSRRVTFAIE